MKKITVVPDELVEGKDELKTILSAFKSAKSSIVKDIINGIDTMGDSAEREYALEDIRAALHAVLFYTGRIYDAIGEKKKSDMMHKAKMLVDKAG